MSSGPVQNQGEKSVASSSVSQFGRLKPTREIHELRVRTFHIQAEVKLQQTQFNRLKEEILSHREAITRAVQKKTVEHAPGATLHKSMIQQLERSPRSAREVLRKLEDEINDAEVDDKMAFARETEEELKEMYLQYETARQQELKERHETQRRVARLKEVDQKASHEHLMELRQAIQENKALNMTLSHKLGAYQRKIQRIQTEKQIVTNQRNKRTFDGTLPEIQSQRQQITEQLKEIKDEVQEEEQKYRRLSEVILNQRWKITVCLTGHDQQPPPIPNQGN